MATALKRRYKVQYARPDGNVYDVTYGPLYSLVAAQEVVVIERELHRQRGWTLCVFITDLDNEEAGDLSNVDAEEYEERYASEQT